MSRSIIFDIEKLLYFPADTTPFFSVQIRPIAKSLKKAGCICPEKHGFSPQIRNCRYGRVFKNLSFRCHTSLQIRNHMCTCRYRSIIFVSGQRQRGCCPELQNSWNILP